MSSRFSVHVKTVQKVVERYGKLVTYNQVSASSSANPWESTSQKGEDKIIRMIFLPPTASGETLFGKELLNYLKGTETSTKQIRGYMAYNGFEPKLNDVVTDGAKVLTIKAVDTLAPDGTSILHVLEFE